MDPYQNVQPNIVTGVQSSPFESTLKITNLYFIGIPYGYVPMVRRSYAINSLNAENLRHIQNVVDEQRTYGKISPSAIAQSLGGIIGLKGLSDGTRLIDMPNGWTTQRYRVILTVDIQSGVVKKKLLIQGYTDFMGVANAFNDNMSAMQQLNQFSPDMQIFINSINEINIIYNRYEGRYSYSMGETYNTLQDYISKYEQGMDNDLALIRPSDIMRLNSVRTPENYGDMAMDGNYHGFGEYTSHTCNPSVRKNLDPSTYFSRIINGYIVGQANASISYDGYDMENVHINAATHAAEPRITNNLFIMKLKEIMGVYNPTVLRIGDLMQLDPTLPHSVGVIGVFNNTSVGEYTKFLPELGSLETSHTVAPSPRNLQILELNNAIVGNLVSVGLSQVTFTLDTFMSIPVIAVMQAKSLLGDEFVPECVERFKAICETQIIPHVTRNNYFKYQISVHADIMKDTTIAITEEGDFQGPKEVFRFPTFADSLYNPMIATKEDRNVFLRDLDQIQENVISSKGWV